MAVDAQHLHHLLPAGHLQPAATAAAHGHAARAGAAAAAAAMGGGAAAAPFSAPRQYGCYGGGEVVATGGAAVEGQQGYDSSYMGLPTSTAAAAGAGVDQYSQFLTLAAVDLAQRGANTFGGSGAQGMTTNKRKRAEQYSPVLGAAEAAAHAQQQLIVVDRLLLNHAAKMWTGLAEQRRRHMRVIAAAVEAKAAKRLRAKDEEIERMRRMNWALEERLRTVCVEAQVWRDLAQSNEAAANVLRGELEQALDAQAAQARCADGGGGGGDDAESCCCAENDVAVDRGEEEVRTPVERPRGAGRCKGCGEGAAVVLLLPCRHLCACAPCAASVPACPACGCAKNGSVCVNFS